ncbi:UDP-glycosyltransferase 74E2-like [Pistacia vera]|uniref:UDP-glycosyltransferase 74E2-like n=1 Tax=Pistacia vera TaxID=55513 RepID=UPI0012633E32|nr:UDP-glycosyltransferase 74E2-like [Pistacia vera]
MEPKSMEQGTQRETHILCFCFPAQGHINPILQFSKRLASKGLKVTLVSSSSSTVSSKFIQTQATSINIEIISDDKPDEGQSRTANLDFFEAYKICVSQSLSEFIKKQLSSEYPPKFIIYDSIIPWILDIARGFGMDGAPFFTQPWAVNSIYYHFLQGQFKIPLEEPIVSLPSMPPLKLNDLPSFFDATDAYPTSLNMLVNQFSNVEKLNWLFCNTFDELEDEIVKWMASKYPVKNIGPSIPSTYIDKRLENDKNYGLSLFKPTTDSCLKWLDSKEIGSVVYVSFGSFSAIEKEQLEEVAWGLKMSNCYFLWAVRESESGKLPRNFSEETSEKGLVVSWCPQLEVLAHKSVGCFVTHCGWNSTLEALSLGVAMVAMPQWTDQTTNAKFVEDVWRVGVRVRVNEKGIVTREEIEVCMREVMEGERGKEISRNSEKWKELAKEAIDEGGCSDKNIEEFVAKLLCS